MELKAGKGAGDRTGPDWKAALQREREEQQHLLAESYSAVMELTRQLQISEHNWAQEKLQLVERLQGEKQQVEQQPSTAQAGVQQPPATSTGGPAASAASASVSTQVEPEEPEADQHQQLQYQQPGVSVICEYQGSSEVARHALS